MNQRFSNELNELLYQLQMTQSFYKILLIAIVNNDESGSNLYLSEFAELIEKRLNRISRRLDKLWIKSIDINN